MEERLKNYTNLNYPEDMLSIIKNGLKKPKNPKTILIAGAGISGLVAASLLKEAGYHVIIIEGNNRVGGRIFTIRYPFTDGNYLDMGAMRIPSNHSLVMEYIKRFNLTLNPFYNDSPKDFIFVNNVKTTQAYYEKHPEVLNYPLDDWEEGKTATELLQLAVQPFLDLYDKSTDEEKERLKKKYSDYSMGRYLANNPLGPSMSNNAIRMISVLLGIEGFPEFSFVDILTDIIYPIFNKKTKFFEILGGNDQLPKSFLAQLENDIYFNQKITKIYQNDDGVIFETKDLSTGEICLFKGDAAIITLPFSVLQFIEILPFDSVSYKKRQAIAELMMVPSIKIGIEFKNRFWEQLGYGNIISDRPTRFTYIPSHASRYTSTGVLLASYSWGQNALLWNSLTQDQITKYVLKDLAEVYGPIVYREYLQSLSFNWSQNPFSAGCFTLFTPGQENNIADFIRNPEGKLHFAGEHTSDFHGWMEGGVESGIRTAYEVNLSTLN